MGSGLEQALSATAGRSRFTVLEHELGVEQVVADIGIAPLRDDRSGSATSWVMVLEYAARGIYPVRSATAEYERLGLGWRATAPRDWAKAITKAVQDGDWRREQARLAHRAVLDRHLTEHTVPLWLQAWQRAAENRASALRRGAVAVG